MDDLPRVSVGIPFHDDKRTLADAIRSVLAQSYPAWELILLDDGSADGSLEVARSARDGRVRVAGDGRNLGVAARHNEIAGMARGEYLAKLDADDLMHPERLARQVAYLDAHPEVDLLGTATYVISETGEPTGVRGLEPLDPRPASVLRHGLLIHTTVTGRTEWFRRNRYDPGFRRVQDRELWRRSTRHSQFAQLDEPLHFYREAGPPSVRSYCQRRAGQGRLWLRHGPATVGWPATLCVVATSLLKPLPYALLAALGLHAAFRKPRHRPLTDEERAAASQALERIRRTVVEGLDGRGECQAPN